MVWPLLYNWVSIRLEPPFTCLIFNEYPASALAATPEEIEIKSGIGYVFNNQNQQGKQYNNCTVTIPESLLTALQQSLSTLQEAIKLCSEQNNDLLKSNNLLREREESLMKELEKLKHRVS
jgi:hypothetical protein